MPNVQYEPSQFIGVKSVKIFYDSLNNKQLKEYTDVFNEVFWQVLDGDFTSADMLGHLMFEYYWYARNFKNRWYEMQPYFIPEGARDFDEEEVLGIINNYLFVRIIPKYIKGFHKYQNPFIYVKEILDKQLCWDIGKAALPYYTTSHEAYLSETNKALHNIVSIDEAKEEMLARDDSYDIDIAITNTAKIILIEKITEYALSQDNGYLFIERMGLDGCERPTVKALAEKYELTPKFINYWVDKIGSQVIKKFGNEYAEIME